MRADRLWEVAGATGCWCDFGRKPFHSPPDKQSGCSRRLASPVCSPCSPYFIRDNCTAKRGQRRGIRRIHSRYGQRPTEFRPEWTKEGDVSITSLGRVEERWQGDRSSSTPTFVVFARLGSVARLGVWCFSLFFVVLVFLCFCCGALWCLGGVWVLLLGGLARLARGGQVRP